MNWASPMICSSCTRHIPCLKLIPRTQHVIIHVRTCLRLINSHTPAIVKLQILITPNISAHIIYLHNIATGIPCPPCISPSATHRQEIDCFLCSEHQSPLCHLTCSSSSSSVANIWRKPFQDGPMYFTFPREPPSKGALSRSCTSKRRAHNRSCAFCRYPGIVPCEFP